MSVSADAVPVYPRWRGELAHIIDSFFCFGGLSPLARGTL
ncbi:hypothetical protein ECAI27_19670 [Escherichia coli AI27]|nr:hypothetical protein ECAI27_19670 [Escherichia coli AI27]